ncbi:hypothetical protein [Nitrospira sp. BLG_1]|uniref:hypothetical protein n=1 Tax=Nitrospira sp. BLG_1 TaxID=3395883 RepID=UPI0039BCAF73
MRQYIETCLRALTGHKGRFSDDMVRYWQDVQKKYSSCNQPMMPQDHIPMWYERAMDKGIPVAFVEPEKPLIAVEEVREVKPTPKPMRAGALVAG